MLLFGRNYQEVGSSNSDFLIKTKGQIKIQWGNKFIDLIKDGKINADTQFIYKLDTVGTKDGIYITNDVIVLVVNGEQINLSSEGTYVSFMENLKSTATLKYNALTNIGFIYDSIESINSDSLQNGIVYTLKELKLYTIQDGIIRQYSIAIPTPYTNLFILTKNDDNKGALIISGTGVENSIAFNKFYIYNGDDYARIDSLLPLLINNTVISDSFQSTDYKLNSGFKLYVSNTESNLNIDNVDVRNKLLAELAAFKNAYYNTNLPELEDSSYSFATTNLIHRILPKGAIIMFSGEEIPEGWHICDGTENTPNLIGKFIKASTVAGETGGSSEITIATENLPAHTHRILTDSLTTTEAGEHSHTITGSYVTGSIVEGELKYLTNANTIDTSLLEAHTHEINLKDIKLSYIGEDKPISFEPSYYSLIYIMKMI